jgi:hypothetical protein
MPRRSNVGLDDVASFDTLATAFWRAARHARGRAEVEGFAAQLPDELARLRAGILEQRVPDGPWQEIAIFDPKPRRVLAPCFRDRVLHHAMMIHMGPVLDRALVDDTFACRVGRGVLAAVRRAQAHARVHPWFVKVDMRSYFASIDHEILCGLLHRRFKNPGLLGLCERIVRQAPASGTTLGRGLPIGALTSQHFANTYLDALDRFLLERLRVAGMVRYMDDVVWWCRSREHAQETLAAARSFVGDCRGLSIKPDARIGRSVAGVSFLGFRILPHVLRLSCRRRRRHRAARLRWERRFREGGIGADDLQRGYASAHAIVHHAACLRWRTLELQRRPPVDA